MAQRKRCSGPRESRVPTCVVAVVVGGTGLLKRTANSLSFYLENKVENKIETGFLFFVQSMDPTPCSACEQFGVVCFGVPFTQPQYLAPSRWW